MPNEIILDDEVDIDESTEIISKEEAEKRNKKIIEDLPDEDSIAN